VQGGAWKKIFLQIRSNNLFGVTATEAAVGDPHLGCCAMSQRASEFWMRLSS